MPDSAPPSVSPRRLLRVLALMATGVVALSGCSSDHGSDAPRTTTSSSASASTSGRSPSGSTTASSPASSASTAASDPGQATQVIAFNPWTADGDIRSGWDAENGGDTECGGDPSSFGVGDNTYDCSGGNSSACATSSTSQSEVACLVDPWQKTLSRFTAESISSHSALVPNSTGRGKDPQAFETADGRKFVNRASGAVERGSADHIARYWCVGGCDRNKNFAAFAWDDDRGKVGQASDGYDPVVQRDGRTWKAKVQVYDQPGYHPETVSIAKAWFVTGDADQAGAGSVQTPVKEVCPGRPQLPEGVVACGDSDGAAEASGSAAVVQSPSQNIMCSLTEDNLDCTMNQPRARIDIDGSGAAADSTRDDGPPEAATQTLEYGETIRLGSFVCSSHESGMACWNKDSQHGMFLSKNQTEKW